MALIEMSNVKYSKLVRPRHGHRDGGDSALIQEMEDGLFLAIIDVLGHGLEAHEVACEIEHFLEKHATRDIAEIMGRLHEHLKGTRGAAVGLGFLQGSTGQLRYCGIGNTVARTFGSREQRLVSRDGVLGQNLRTMREGTLVLADGDLLLLYTDGVRTHFELKEYPQLLSDDTETVVKTILQRFGKDHDDAACIAVRYQA